MVRKARTPCVGLFGTCGGSTWRDPFMAEYERHGIRFFNPQVEEWDPSMADIEARHLDTDEIVLFPVTWETYALGSLSESGFSLIKALQNPLGRDFIVAIYDYLDPSLDDPALIKESLRARALVTAHLKKINLPNVYQVRTLDDMLMASLELHRLRTVQASIDSGRASLRKLLLAG